MTLCSYARPDNDAKTDNNQNNRFVRVRGGQMVARLVDCVLGQSAGSFSSVKYAPPRLPLVFFCFVKNSSPGPGTCGGNAEGADCVFPFKYKSKTYHACTTVDRDQPWCATKQDYWYHKQWGNCNCGKCKFRSVCWGRFVLRKI